LPESPHPHWLRAGANFVTLEVIARPASQRRGLLRVEGRGLVIGVASPAEKGKANEELMTAIADITGVPRGEVSILRGAASRNKVIRIAGADPVTIVGRIVLASSAAKEK